MDDSADPVLVALIDELKHYPVPPGTRPPGPSRQEEFLSLAVPLELKTDDGVLSFISTTTVFGTPIDIGLSEIAIESFFPADPATAEAMRKVSRGG